MELFLSFPSDKGLIYRTAQVLKIDLGLPPATVISAGMLTELRESLDAAARSDRVGGKSVDFGPRSPHKLPPRLSCLQPASQRLDTAPPRGCLSISFLLFRILLHSVVNDGNFTKIYKGSQR